MHQDQRIGLALGVLLVGACAAFFFRNETRAVPNSPRLHRADELDERIAERSTRPYLKGIEVVEASDRRRTGANSDKDGSRWNPLDLNSNETGARERKLRGKLADNDGDVQELPPINIPADHEPMNKQAHDINSATTNDAIANRSNQVRGDVGLEEQTYVVQKGETLTSIATKTLGNPSRFHDLFEANRDQLNDPNDLKLGMTLHIPPARSEASSKPHFNRARVSEESDPSTAVPSAPSIDAPNDIAPPSHEPNSASNRNNSRTMPSIETPATQANPVHLDAPEDSSSPDDSDGTRRFIPARRIPPPSRHAEPQAKLKSPRETGGRRLSQVSSDLTPGKIAR